MTATMHETSRRTRRLYKDPTDKMIAGVASGVAKYFDVDTTLVRVLWASAVVFGGFGVVAYVLLWLILDDEPAPDADLGLAADIEPAADMTNEPVSDVPTIESAEEPSGDPSASNFETPPA